jgi:hypothetical protein
MPTRFTEYWQDGAANIGANYAVTTIGAGQVLTRVTVRAAITFPIATTTDTGEQFTANTMMGLQLLINGSSLLTLPADITDSRWLTVQTTDPSSVAATWAPSSDTAAVGSGSNLTLRWAGQIVMQEEMVFALTTGNLGSSTPAWFLYGGLEAWLG